jgi:hypothetical protein
MMKLFDYDDPDSLVYRLRRRRSAALGALIEKIVAETGGCRVLDIGGEARYWRLLFGEPWMRNHHVHVTLLNHTDEYVGEELNPELFGTVVADGCALIYDDRAFDLCHSNSVIEHVGDWSRKVAFARETRRVAPHYYVQTPAFSFPIEPHYRMPFFHWLPEPARVWTLRHFSLGPYPRATTLDQAMSFHEDARLLTASQFRHLFPDAEIRHERLLGLTKSLMAVRG